MNLQARPPALGAAVCPFDEVSQAIETVVNIRQLAIPIARVGACYILLQTKALVFPFMFLNLYTMKRQST